MPHGIRLLIQANNYPKGNKQMTSKIDELFGFSFIREEDEDFDTLDVESVAVRAQYILDGASTLEEAADMARAFADYLDSLAENGYELAGMIQDDRGVASIGD